MDKKDKVKCQYREIWKTTNNIACVPIIRAAFILAIKNIHN